jgi:hypothetical protein
MVVVVVLLATVVLRAVIVLTFVYLMLPKHCVCPQCGAPLARVHHALLRLLAPVVEHRWCLDCGWSGLVRPQPRPTQSRVISRAARS